MSKRARITLNSEMETEASQEANADPLAQDEAQTSNDFTAAAEAPPSAASLPAWKALPVGSIVKAAVAGLAVVAMVLIWKNKRP